MRRLARYRFPALLSVIAALSLSTSVLALPRLVWAVPAREPTRRVAAFVDRTYSLAVDIGDRHIHAVGQPIAVPLDGTISIMGWAIDSRTMKPVASVLFGIDDDKQAPISEYPLHREDVARALHDPAAANSGFRLSVSLTGRAPGLHRIHFSIVGSDGFVSALPTDVLVDIRR